MRQPPPGPSGAKRKLTVPESGASRLVRNGRGSVGCQLDPPRSSPTGRDTRIPASLTIASTVSTEVGAPLLRAKNRSVGCSSVMHVAGDVAELPAGSESELRSLDELTENDSLPATSLAPPVSDQPVAFSSEPFWSST